MLQCVTAGESHGSSLIAVLSGIPAGIEFSTAELRHVLARRRLGYGRGARQKFEQDETRIISGMRHGKTLGSPLAIEIKNTEWPKWTAVMSPDAVLPEALLVDAGKGDVREVARNQVLTKPRPGHADFAGMMKYGFTDARNVLERSSARETAARVALGAVAEAILAQIAGIQLVSHVVALGDIEIPVSAPIPRFADNEILDNNPVRCFDVETSEKMMARIDQAQKSADTLGGVVEVIAYGVPVGLGSYVTHEERLDSRLAAAVMSIQAIKGVEIGRAFLQASLPGSQAHDAIYISGQAPHDKHNETTELTAQVGSLTRVTNLAGGIEGGMSNGSPIVVRAAVKPISTVPNALPTVDLATGETAIGLHQRSDTTAVVPAALVTQAEVAVVLAQALLDKTGGDSVVEAKRNLEAYSDAVRERTTFL